MLYKNGSPCHIDVILTKCSILHFYNINLNCDLSGRHNMIATVFKDSAVSNKRQTSLLEVTKTSVRQTSLRISRGLLFT